MSLSQCYSSGRPLPVFGCAVLGVCRNLSRTWTPQPGQLVVERVRPWVSRSVIADVARPQECNAENSTPCTEDIDSPMSEGSVDDHLFIAEKADETNTLATYQPYS